jgi:hypothetical protein
MSFDQSYRYLDSEDDRQRLLVELRQVRQAVRDMTQTVPEAQWYEPRYHNWSLAAMLGHLQMIDHIHLLLIQMALLGIRFPLSLQFVNQVNDFMARLFQRRVVAASLKGMEKQQAVIEAFISTLPIDQFTKQVYYPPQRKNLTIEQAVQVMFLHHWQDHLQTMLDVEGIQYEPPRDASSN